MSAPSKTRVGEVIAKRSGPCVICGSLDGQPRQVSPTRSFTENNVLSFCAGCIDQMCRPRSAALDKLRLIVNNDDWLYRLIGDDVDWMYENGRGVRS